MAVGVGAGEPAWEVSAGSSARPRTRGKGRSRIALKMQK